jgi:hypothetical protein
MRKGLLFLVLAMAWQNAAAQPFKCTDAAGKITYAGTTCSELGLKDAGEVKDRLQVTPAPPARPASKSTASSSSQVEQTVKPPAAEEKPERRCFTTNIKGKSVTRCNDKPDEE